MPQIQNSTQFIQHNQVETRPDDQARNIEPRVSAMHLHMNNTPDTLRIEKLQINPDVININQCIYAIDQLQSILMSAPPTSRFVSEPGIDFESAEQFKLTLEKSRQIRDYVCSRADALLSNMNNTQKEFLRPYINSLINSYVHHFESQLHYDYNNSILACMQYKIFDALDSLALDQSLTRNALLMMKSLQASPYGLVLYSVLSSTQSATQLLNRCKSILNEPEILRDPFQFKLALVVTESLNHGKKLKWYNNSGQAFGFHGINGAKRNFDLHLPYFQRSIQEKIVNISSLQFNRFAALFVGDIKLSMLDQFNKQFIPANHDKLQQIENTLKSSYKKELSFLNRFYHIPQHIYDTFTSAFQEIERISLDKGILNPAILNQNILVKLDATLTASKKTPVLLQTLQSFHNSEVQNQDLTACDSMALEKLGFSTESDAFGHTDLDRHLEHETGIHFTQHSNQPDQRNTHAFANLDNNDYRQHRLFFNTHIFESLINLIKKAL